MSSTNHLDDTPYAREEVATHDSYVGARICTVVPLSRSLEGNPGARPSSGHTPSEAGNDVK